MGWWESEDGQLLLGDGPADKLSQALQEFSRSRGRRATVEEFLASMHAGLEINPPDIVNDAGTKIAELRAILTDRSLVSGPPRSSDPLLVRLIRNALEDIAVEYEDTERRKPMLREVLATAAFILRPEDQEFITVPGGGGVDHIEATDTPT